MGDDLTAQHAAIGEGDLLAYLDGVAAPAAALHIAACPRCRADLAALRRLDGLFAAAHVRAACPSPELLLQYQAELLGPTERRPIANHLLSCADCNADLAALAAPFAPGPLEQLANAGARLLRAVLQPSQQPALALRGAAGQSQIFSAGEYQVLIAIGPPAAPGGSAQIEGQISGADELLAAGPGEALLWRDGQQLRADAVDELGFFAFDGLGSGDYRVELRLGPQPLIIDGLSVRV
jgi:hypothetical protein